MAACVHCGRGKGKRTCPALAGMICAPCCGKHRLRAIDCPADCAWLGGLAAIKDGGPLVYSTDDAAAAREALVGFTETAGELATSRAGFCRMMGLTHQPSDEELVKISEEVGETTAAVVTAYIAFGHRAADGTRAVDRLLVGHGRDLARGTVTAVRALQALRAVLAELTAVQAGVGLVLRDRLTDEIITVATEPGDDLAVGQTAYLWLTENGGAWSPTGPMIDVPRPQVGEVEARLRAALDGADGDERRLRLAAAAPLVIDVLRAAEEAAAAPPPAG